MFFNWFAMLFIYFSMIFIGFHVTFDDFWIFSLIFCDFHVFSMILLFFIRKIGFQPPSRNIYENRSSALFRPVNLFVPKQDVGFLDCCFNQFSGFFDVFRLICKEFQCFSNYFQSIFQWFSCECRWFSCIFNQSSMISNNFRRVY